MKIVKISLMIMVMNVSNQLVASDRLAKAEEEIRDLHSRQKVFVSSCMAMISVIIASNVFHQRLAENNKKKYRKQKRLVSLLKDECKDLKEQVTCLDKEMRQFYQEYTQDKIESLLVLLQEDTQSEQNNGGEFIPEPMEENSVNFSPYELLKRSSSCPSLLSSPDDNLRDRFIPEDPDGEALE